MHKHSERGGIRSVLLAIAALVLLMAIALVVVKKLESGMAPSITDAGQQLTSHSRSADTAQVFMNDRWYAQRNMETLLIMGVDDLGRLNERDGYGNTQQTDFLVLFMRDLDTGRTGAIHLNRDTVTDINTIGLTGQNTGMRRAQLALAYNYGNDDNASSMNVVAAVERLLYGIEVDHYITVTMDSVPIINDWAGGVMVEVLDDFTGIDNTLVQGEMVKLKGAQALTYVRSRKGLDDSSNVRRMERQRQYASEWASSAKGKLEDTEAVTELVFELDGYYCSSCTIDDLNNFAKSLASNPSVPIYEVAGKAVKGDEYMEFHVDEEELQQLVLKLFYVPVS